MSPPRVQQRIKPKAPEPAAKPTLEDIKKLLDTSATTNRNLLVGFYVLLLAALMLCLGITDEQLLVGNTTIPLPFLNIPLPVSAFATVLPLVLMAVHFDLLHNLNEHGRKLQVWVAAWEEKYPANNPATTGMNAALSEQLFPFLYDFAWLHAKGKGPDNINAKLLPGLCWVLYCWAPYTVLVIFLIRFADLQDYVFTSWHLGLILLDAAWLYWYWPRFGRKKPQHLFWRGVRKVVNLPLALVSVSSLAGCWCLGLYSLIQWHLDFDGSPDIVKKVIEFEEQIQSKLSIVLVPRLVIDNYRIKIDDNHFKVARLLAPGKTDAELWPDTASPLNLHGRRFGFAQFINVVMPRVNFNEAKLQGANLRSAQLQGAYLRGAQLQGAFFAIAHMQGAFLQGARLQGANLHFAQLQGADLSYAKLQGTALREAKLQGAHLSFANLDGADLLEAQLQGADLIEASLQGAALGNAELQGANLRGAVLQGADLSKTELRTTILPDSVEFSATIGEPDWSKFEPLLPMLNEDWAKKLSASSLANLKETMTEAEKRNKSFVMPNLPAKNSQKFVQAWLKTVCLNDAVAKNMLYDSIFSRLLPNEITDTALRTHMQTEAKCKPYQALAEQVIQHRAERLRKKP